MVTMGHKIRTVEGRVFDMPALTDGDQIVTDLLWEPIRAYFMLFLLG